MKKFFLALLFLLSQPGFSQVMVLMTPVNRCQPLQNFINKPFICGTPTELQNLLTLTSKYDDSGVQVIHVHEEKERFYLRDSPQYGLSFYDLTQYIGEALEKNGFQSAVEVKPKEKIIPTMTPVKFGVDDIGKMPINKKTNLKFNVDFTPDPSTQFRLLPEQSALELNPRFSLQLNYKW